MVVQDHIAQQRLLQILTTVETVASQHIGDAPIKALDHVVGARRSGFGQAALDVQADAHLIEFVLAGGLLLVLVVGGASPPRVLEFLPHHALRRDRQPLLVDRRARDVAVPLLQRVAFLSVVGDNRAQRDAANLTSQDRRPAAPVRVAVQPKQRCVSPYLR